MKTAQQATEKYIANSIRAYLEGTKSEKWLLGVARAAGIDDLRTALVQYGNDSRLAFLKQSFAL